MYSIDLVRAKDEGTFHKYKEAHAARTITR